MKDEVRPSQRGRMHGISALRRGLRVGQLGGTERPPAAQRQAKVTGDLADGIVGHDRLGHAESRRPGFQRHRRQEVAQHERRARSYDLAVGRAGQALGDSLRNRGRRAHRPHGTAEDEGHHHDPLPRPAVDLDRL